MNRVGVTRVLQVAGLVILAFVLLRVVGPWLVDLHDTAALILAAALLAGGVGLVVWFVWTLFTSAKS